MRVSRPTPMVKWSSASGQSTIHQPSPRAPREAKPKPRWNRGIVRVFEADEVELAFLTEFGTGSGFAREAAESAEALRERRAREDQPARRSAIRHARACLIVARQARRPAIPVLT